MQKNKVTFVIVLAALFGVFVFQRTLAEKVNFQGYSAGQWKSGQQIYQTLCIHCHGTGIGPVILGRHYSSLALMILVRNGINTMPTFRVTEFNDQELDSLAKWVEQSAAPVASSKESGK